MRIAQVPPLYEAVPPRLYGGTERVVAHLSDALVELGHEVTLFASAEAETKARLVVVRDQAIRLDPAPLKSDLAAHLSMLLEVRDRADQFDLIHFHTDMLQFGLFADMAGKTLTTLHGRLDMKDLAKLYRRYPEFGLVSISDSQRAHLADANWVGTVLHGIHTDSHEHQEQTEGYLAFLGRISPEKGPDRAIAIARRAGRRLKIAAKVDQADRAYFHEVVEPLLSDPLVEFIGEIGDRDKGAFLGGADALLFPIDWPEPFGLVMIEAMAAGTPVIAYDRGSVREVIEDGLTGFIVNSEQEAADAVARLSSLSRRAVRDRFDLRFSATAMARRYQVLYAQRIQSAGASLSLALSA
ncbi:MULTISPECIES: glycosyltransferase family 4 protein [unclassified Caulobacter]|uniref:glycosyltransferase family 4 protein n=1 Tax=unclassified Caulobacter TaxID=2648921 RepID=UPI000D38FD78|nr:MULTISPECIES: glycosyltransferase family 4 protein [unclassified Caulobacter]PTS83228.1 glycosyl transferase [Caulobacter sp. HMWF009]PTT06671.1 glycosyl transferase [Caulobacter sp. HMWF025]